VKAPVRASNVSPEGLFVLGIIVKMVELHVKYTTILPTTNIHEGLREGFS